MCHEVVCRKRTGMDLLLKMVTLYAEEDRRVLLSGVGVLTAAGRLASEGVCNVLKRFCKERSCMKRHDIKRP